MDVSGQLHASTALIPGERASCTHSIGGWVGPRAGLDATKKRKFLPLPESNPGSEVACRYTNWAIQIIYWYERMKCNILYVVYGYLYVLSWEMVINVGLGVSFDNMWVWKGTREKAGKFNNTKTYIMNWSTIDHWRSRCKGRISGPPLLHTYIYNELWDFSWILSGRWTSSSLQKELNFCDDKCCIIAIVYMFIMCLNELHGAESSPRGCLLLDLSFSQRPVSIFRVNEQTKQISAGTCFDVLAGCFFLVTSLATFWPWSCRQQVPPKRRCTSMVIRGVTSQKAALFTLRASQLFKKFPFIYGTQSQYANTGAIFWRCMYHLL
jgi:hypothetical protein